MHRESVQHRGAHLRQKVIRRGCKFASQQLFKVHERKWNTAFGMYPGLNCDDCCSKLGLKILWSPYQTEMTACKWALTSRNLDKISHCRADPSTPAAELNSRCSLAGMLISSPEESTAGTFAERCGIQMLIRLICPS